MYLKTTTTPHPIRLIFTLIALASLWLFAQSVYAQAIKPLQVIQKQSTNKIGKVGNVGKVNKIVKATTDIRKSAAELKRNYNNNGISSNTLINTIPLDSNNRPIFIGQTAPAGFTASDILVEGLTDIDPLTVYNYLPIKVGDEVNQMKIQKSIQSLFATGLFDDVAISKKGTILIVSVIERKVLGKLNIIGAYEFPEDQLKDSLRAIGLFEGKTYDPVLLGRAEQELKNQYLAKGFYSTKVSQEIKKIDDKRIEVSLKIEEGQIAKIKSIKIFGNQKVSTSKILGLMDSTDSPFLTSRDRYSGQRLEADLERVSKYYLNNGFLDFKLESAQVSISDDLNDMFISIGIDEGELFTIREVSLDNPSDNLNKEEFSAYNQIAIGENFSQKKADKLARRLKQHLSNQGYAFPDIQFRKIKSTNPSEKNILLLYQVAENRRIVVSKITVTGNTRTSDEVIRREFRLKEGDLYNSTLLAQSRRRIERLGFFADVSVTPKRVAGTLDQMEIIARVTERRTGNLSFGISSSNTDTVAFNASIQQNNWGGSGKLISLAFDTSDSNKSLKANYYDPYITDWGLGFGMSAYKTSNDSSSGSTARYKTISIGAGARINYPLTENSNVGLGVQGSVNEYTLFDDSPDLYIEQAKEYGAEPKDYVGYASYAIDLRDSSIYPMSGFYGRVYTESTIANSDFKYDRHFLTLQGYLPLSETVAVLLNTDFNKADPKGNNSLPFSKFLYVGGISSVRGYESDTLGPYDDETNRYTGGDRSFNANMEVLFPFPGQARSKEARLALFADAGMAWGINEEISDRELRTSWGLALSWASPVGPLRFSYAFPIDEKADDKIEQFQFRIGTAF